MGEGEGRRASLDADVSLRSLEAVHDLLATWVEGVDGLSPQRRFGFETAVIEVAGNIIEHSRDPEGTSGRRFSLELDADGESISARFEDNGIPAAVDLSAVTMAGPEEESGRGLALAQAGVDRLDYHYENGRNVWRVECRRA
jgi:serine/threonine-protein kinase RsbW